MPVQKQPNLFGEMVKPPMAKGANVGFHRNGSSDKDRDKYADNTLDGSCQWCTRRDWDGDTDRCPRCHASMTFSQQVNDHMKKLVFSDHPAASGWAEVASEIKGHGLNSPKGLSLRVPNSAMVEFGLDKEFAAVSDETRAAWRERSPELLREAVGMAVDIIERVKRARS